jgi:TRAP-type C4-dicarboxylate transport system substrate-binding protein
MERNMKGQGIIKVCIVCLGLIVSTVPSWAVEKPETIGLTYTLHTPPPPKGGGTADQAAFEYWTKQIEAKTEGRIRFKMQYSGVLGKPTDFIKMVGGVGVADVGNIIGTYNQWQVPLFSGAMLPFLTTGVDIEMRALTKLYNDWAPMREEWTKHNLKPLWWYVIDPYFLLIKKKIERLDDLKGAKIWGAGGFGEIIKQFGITQVFFPATQAYEALQKGTLEGIVFPYGPISVFKFYEITKIFVDMSFAGGQTPAAQAINLDVWNKIPPDDQKIIEDVSGGMRAWYEDYFEKDQKRLNEFYKSQRVEYITFSFDEQAKVREKCAEVVWNDWIAKAEVKGVPAKEFLNRYKAIVKELSKPQ